MTINSDKCVFGQQSVKYLGYIVDRHGIRPHPVKVAAIAQYAKPTMRKDLKRFLKHSTYDRELLAIFLAIHHFKYLLEGREFTIFPDHKPLTYAFDKKPDQGSPRQQTQLQFIAQFSTDIQHIAGKDNIPADCLSRSVDAIQIQSIDWTTFAHEQRNCKEVQGVVASSSHTMKLSKEPHANTKEDIIVHTSPGRPRSLVPVNQRRIVIQ